MKNNINEFMEEITTNFSLLFVETFFIRYLSIFPKEELLKNIQKTNKLLNKKLQKEFRKKLNDIGF